MRKYRVNRGRLPPMTKQQDPQTQLYKLWRGLSNDLFEAEEAHALSWEIGQNADAINAASFRSFFGSLQRITGKYTYIAVGRLFESPNGIYRINSIPSALTFIEEHAEVLSIFDRHQIAQAARLKTPGPHSDADLTRGAAKNFRDKIAANKTWKVVKTVRDKRIAHNEVAFPSDSTYAQIDALLDIASAFIHFVARVYLQTTPIIDSHQSIRSMKGLLHQFEIVKTFPLLKKKSQVSMPASSSSP